MALWLDEAQVRAALSLPELVEAMEGALRAFSGGAVEQPLRPVIEIDPRHAFFAAMPAYIKDPPALGAKLVTVVESNARRGLPTHLATILIFDAETGETRAVMDGRYITEVRTAAVSAVSVRHMARADAAVLAILGTGVQARSHLAALPLVRAFREVRVWSPTREHRERFAAAHAGTRDAASAEEAVREADVVVLATSSPAPVLEATWVMPGAHVISVGACRPSQREMDPALVERGRLIVDSRAAALSESGDVAQGIVEGRFTAAHIAGELGEVAAGRVAGRTSAEEITIFKSLGLAVEDVVAAEMVWRHFGNQPQMNAD